VPFHGASRHLGLFAIVVAAVVLTGTVSAGASVRAAGHFSDARGDNGSAADVLTLDASDSNGAISVDVGFEPTQVLPQGDSIQVEFDTDRNPSTGDQDGGDYGLVMFGVPGSNPVAFAFFKLSQSDAVQVHVDSLSVTWALGHVAMKIAAADLGGTQTFDFWVVSFHGDAANPDALDFVPDRGSFTYRVGDAQTQTLNITGPVTAVKARAGRTWAIVYRITSVSGASLSTVQLACHGSVGGRALSGRPVFEATATFGIALCSFKLPKSARGKTLRGAMDLTYEGVTAHKSFAVRVR
jgi:hypothetical protein